MTAIFRSPHYLRSRLSGYGLNVVSPARAGVLNIGSQRVVCRPACFQGSQDDVSGDRRSPEDLVTQSVRKSVQDCGTTAANWRFADAARAYGRLRVWNFDGPPGHLIRYIQNRRRLGVVKTPGHWNTVLLIVDPLLADRVTNA